MSAMLSGYLTGVLPQVLEQADIIDHVHAQAVTATENTKVRRRRQEESPSESDG